MRLLWLCCVLASSIVSGSADAGDRYRPPRLKDGKVDLQGMWAHTNLTPLERPPELKTFVITREEAARFKAKLDARNDDLTRPAEPSLYFDDRTVEPIRGELRSSIIVEPADGLVPGNARYKERVAQLRAALLTAFDGPEVRPNSERCLSGVSAAPPVQLVPATDLRQIVQTPNAILIASEELHEARVVRMNATHAPAAITSWLGDSIGHWDGDTLVIQTRHFAATSEVRASPNNLFLVSPQTVVIERITRVSEDELRYEFTVEDSTWYTQAWRGETRFHRSQARYVEYACHEGNYSLGFGLQGEREKERQAAARDAAQLTRAEPADVRQTK